MAFVRITLAGHQRQWWQPASKRLLWSNHLVVRLAGVNFDWSLGLGHRRSHGDNARRDGLKSIIIEGVNGVSNFRA